MRSACSSHPRRSRRRSLRAAAAVASAFLLFTLGVAGPAWAAGVQGPQRVIFDPVATPSWTRMFHSPGAAEDVAYDVVMAKGDVTYVAGALGGGVGDFDASLMKLRDGVPVWPAPKTYDGPAHGDDLFVRMALGPGGTIYTAGVSDGPGGLPDILVVKWSSSGAVRWARRYDPPSHGVDQATTMVVDKSGNVTVGGMAVTVGGIDWVVVSWSASGAKRWTSRYTSASPHQMMPTGMVVAGDRSVYASGVSATSGSNAVMIVRYSRSGKVLWKKTYKGPSGLGASVWASVARPGGGVYVCGSTLSAATAWDGLVMGYTAKGARDVFALDAGPGGATDQVLHDLALASTGQVVAVGSSTSPGPGNSDCHGVWYTSDGTIVNQSTLPGAWQDTFDAVATDSFGGVYITGTFHTAVNRTAVVTLRGSMLTGGGGFASLWTPTFVTEDNRPYAIAVRGSTACVVGACSEGAAQGIDQLVLGFVY